MAKRYEGKKILRPSVLRGIVVGVVTLAVVASIIFHTGWGTLSALGVGEVFLLCPLGGLEALLGSRSIVVHALVAVVVVALLVVLVGKSFCAWACPVSFLSRFLLGERGRTAAKQEQASCAKLALSAFEESRRACGQGACASCSSELCGASDSSETAGASAASLSEALGSATRAHGTRALRKAKLDSRHFVLAGALGSALIFGFPVFCLVCPIGLTFATVVALVRLIGFNEPTIGLILFPAIIVVELVVLRKWCHTLCPVGALLSLLSTFNRTLRPRVDEAKCLRYAKGELCSACSGACPELIDPHSDLGIRPISECTRCGKCAEACPQGAISFVFRASAAPASREAVLAERASEVPEASEAPARE